MLKFRLREASYEADLAHLIGPYSADHAQPHILVKTEDHEQAHAHHCEYF